MTEKYAKLVFVKNKKIDKTIDLSYDEYINLSNDTNLLNEFMMMNFISVSLEASKKIFLDFINKYDYNNELDFFANINMILGAIKNNKDQWNAFIKRHFPHHVRKEILNNKNKRIKTLFDDFDSDYYDNNINHMLCYNLRNICVHSSRPYSAIEFKDNEKPRFVIFTRDLMKSNLNSSARKMLLKSGIQQFDVLECVKKDLEIMDELNKKIYEQLVEERWVQLQCARYTFIKYNYSEFDGISICRNNPNESNESIHKIEINQVPYQALKIILTMNVSGIMKE